MASLLSIRPVVPDDISVINTWARLEGFAPGVGDINIYRQTDRQGVWMGWLEDQPIGCIAGVRYNHAYGFIGLFLVQRDYRGRGFGKILWQHALDHLNDVACVGLEAAEERIDDYSSWGFKPASPTTRWQMLSSSFRGQSPSISFPDGLTLL